MPTPTGPMALPTVLARATAMMAGCAAGDCRYRDVARSRAACEADWRARCDGYEAHVYLEAAGAVLRWRRCPRAVAWWRVERTRLEKRRAAEARAKRGREAPREWGEHA